MDAPLESLDAASAFRAKGDTTSLLAILLTDQVTETIHTLVVIREAVGRTRAVADVVGVYRSPERTCSCD